MHDLLKMVAYALVTENGIEEPSLKKRLTKIVPLTIGYAL